MNQTARPTITTTTALTRPSPNGLLDQVIQSTLRSGFDADAWHVMDRRDDELISEEVVNGATSGKFVYAFKLKGTEVSGVSVVGARHLAYEYGGLRCSILSSVEKTGNLWLFRTFPASGKFEVRPEHFRDLEDEPDFYEVMLEISDIKTGNSIQVTKRETRQGFSGDGKPYDKPHYRTVAEAKAFRNGILSLLPQDVILKFKTRNLPLAQQKVDIGEDVIAEKRAGILKFAASKGIPVERHAVSELTMEQIAGLAEAARTKDATLFTNAAMALGLIGQPAEAQAPGTDAPKQEAPRRGRPAKSHMPVRNPDTREFVDAETGEITAPASEIPASVMDGPSPTEDLF